MRSKTKNYWKSQKCWLWQTSNNISLRVLLESSPNGAWRFLTLMGMELRDSFRLSYLWVQIRGVQRVKKMPKWPTPDPFLVLLSQDRRKMGVLLCKHMVEILLILKKAKIIPTALFRGASLEFFAKFLICTKLGKNLPKINCHTHFERCFVCL